MDKLDRLDEMKKNLLLDFTESLKLALGVILKSVILYGSFASGQHTKKHSDINILIILERVDLESLHKITAVKKSRRFNDIAPLVFDIATLENSCDIFPIEFLDMQENYIVLFGEDYLKGLKIGTANLRHQCEWELKTKIFRLQQLYVDSQGKNRAVGSFLVGNLPSLLVVFKNILRLKNIAAYNREDIIDGIVKEFNLNGEVFYGLLKARSEGKELKDAQNVFGLMLGELWNLSRAVDKM